MIGGSGLHRRRRKREQADPMAGVANLSDVMLVFACGLMLSILTVWKLNLSDIVDRFNAEDITEIENPEEILRSNDGAGFVEKGIVVEDPETGQMYVIGK